jgi:hypothetical protein
LSVKVKELVVMGVLASRGLQYGVEAHRRRAIEHDATKEELFEAIKAAAVPGGGVAYSVGVRALQALEQDGAFPPPSPPPPARRQQGKPPRTRAPPAPHRAGGAPPRGDGAGHRAPSRCPPCEAHLGGHLTAARDTWLLRAGAFSGSVPLGILRSSPRGGAAV